MATHHAVIKDHPPAWRRITYLLVLLLVFAISGTVLAADLAIVPLDSRPANTYFPQMIAEMADLTVAMPSEIGYFLTPGDGETIGAWLLDTEADAYIISTSMLAYGGLVASRTGDVSLDEAMARVASIEQLRQRRPDAVIFVYDVIQRLAITATSQSVANHYSNVRNWAILKDQVDNLGRADLAGELQSLEEMIPDQIFDDYMAARARNHAINREMIRLVAEGVIDYLVLAQDDASPAGLHRAEREMLREEIVRLGVEDRTIIFPGADEVDIVLIGRYIAQRYDLQPEFAVAYRSANGADWIAPFEDISFGENVARHIEAMGGVLRPQAEMIVYAVTPGGSTTQFITHIEESLAAGQRVVISDVSITNQAEKAFVDALLDNVDILRLSGYAGWNTAGNTLGIALGQGIASLARDTLEGEARVRADQAFIEFLLSRFGKDYLYKAVERPNLDSWVRQRGLDPMNLAMPTIVETELKRRLLPQLESFYATYFADRPWHQYTLPSEAEWFVGLAWPRLFEFRVEPTITLK